MKTLGALERTNGYPISCANCGYGLHVHEVCEREIAGCIELRGMRPSMLQARFCNLCVERGKCMYVLHVIEMFL